jgi:acyl-CoA thioesterase-1
MMSARIPLVVVTLSILLLSACTGTPEVREAAEVSSLDAQLPDTTETMPLDPNLPVILAYGDSLTAGHNVERDRSYPAQLQDRLRTLGYDYQVVNHGNSGDTTAGGIARLEGALAVNPEIVVLAFGGNDGLQGRPIDSMRSNLEAMIEAFKNIDSQIVLAGITLPRNYGPDYIRDFENVYVELAEEHEVALIPFFLEGLVDLELLDAPNATLAESVRYMQSDGTHPTGEGYTIVAETVLDAISPYLSK